MRLILVGPKILALVYVLYGGRRRSGRFCGGDGMHPFGDLIASWWFQCSLSDFNGFSVVLLIFDGFMDFW